VKALKPEELGSIYKMFSLNGKTALVTGACGGIGRSTANAFIVGIAACLASDLASYTTGALIS
jgi:NAD(P)-dependent dehydrogenase (short-subunit alcohol dehydrogenase family)